MLSGLLRKVKSLFGLGEADETATGERVKGSTEPPADYECAVCGTAVDDPDDQCPLCRSTDVVAAGEATDEQEEASADDRLAGGATEARSSESPDDAADRLRELREEQEGGQQGDA